MALIDESGLVGKIRDRLIGQKLREVLLGAANATGIDVIRVTSGSQPGSTGRRTGSTRHDNGRAADLQLVKNGATLEFTDRDGGPFVEDFVTAVAARGATGIGAGVHYMGSRTLHVGFGTSPEDHSRVVWGAGGRSINAPDWLRRAASKGWENPILAATPSIDRGAGRFVVVARDGLRLRKGPGLEFGVVRTLASGTEVIVLGFDATNGEWASVDLQGDSLIDGYLFRGFLRPVDPIQPEEVEEPEGEID